MTDATHPVPVETLLTHRSWVRSLAWGLVRDAHLVDEVEQETWLRALRTPPREELATRGWLATVVRNVVRNRYRSDSRRAVHEGAATPSLAAPATADVVGRAESQQAVVRAVMALDEPYRTTLLLRYFDGLPPREIAARMEVPVETVRTRTKRAIARIRDALSSGPDGRRGAFALLAPLLAEGPPPPLTAAAGASTASVMATTTGALVMSALTKKIVLAAVVVASLAVGSALVQSLEREGAGEAVATVPSEQDEPSSAAATNDETSRRRVQASDPGGAGRDGQPSEALPEEWSTLRVVLPDGSPADAARVVLVDGPSSSDVLEAGPDGRLEVRGSGPRRVVVVAPGRPVHVADVTLGAREADVRLPDGETVEGVVRVAGMTPRSPIRLALGLSAPPPVPEELRPALRAFAERAGGPLLSTDENGRFRFAGLPERGEARLVLIDRDHDFTGEDGPFLDVPVPAHGLVLELSARPRVSGRVVDEAGAPVVDAMLRVRWRSPDNNGSMGGRVDENGRFDVALPLLDLTEVAVVAGHRGDDEPVEVAVPVQPVIGGDIGDVVLATLRTVALRVVDAAGRPVPDATALARGEPFACDPEGRAAVAVAGLRPRVAVGALGYEAAERELPPGIAEPVEIVLQPAARLTLQVMPSSHGIKDLRVRLRSNAGIVFRGGEDGRPSDADAAAGASESGAASFGEREDGTFETLAWYTPDRNGVVVLNALAPDVPFEVTLLDGLGAVHDRRVVRMSGVERRSETLRVRSTPRSVAGTVVDAAGRPIARARVLVTAATSSGADGESVGGPSRAAFTTEAGRFQIDGVFADAVHVLVTSSELAGGEAFVPWARGGVEISAASDMTVQLVRGATVRLTLREAKRTPVEDAWGYAMIDLPFDGSAFLWSLDAVDADDDATGDLLGVYEMVGLPRDGGPVKILIEVEEPGATAIHHVVIDPAAGSQDVTLGEPVSRQSAEDE